jgi:phosphoribosylanthranilate isomerase
MRTRIKICGITRIEDGLAAARAGADAIGLVFYEKSPRCLDLDRARDIVRALPPFITTVGLFVNHDSGFVRDALSSVPLDLLQFHGEETLDYCTAFGKPFLKAVRVREGLNLVEYAAGFGAAHGLLLDAYHPDMQGGTGVTFDWNLIPRGLPSPVVLSGGLDAGNVGAAVCMVRPWAVDVSSGVEAAKGIKDADKITAFVRGVRNADHSLGEL